MARRTKAQILREKRIDRIAQNAVYRIPINIMDTPRVYRVAENIVDQDFDDETSTAKVREFVRTIQAA